MTFFKTEGAFRRAENAGTLLGDFPVHVFVEKVYRYVQHLADVPQVAGADAVVAAFVFLDLLQSQPQQGSELCLRIAEQGSAQTDAVADVDVDRIGLPAWGAAAAGLFGFSQIHLILHKITFVIMQFLVVNVNVFI